ncbi:hypothetical protein Pcinc_006668 [Petrolisthes cinctipes]|uniref:Uncharacterized protein n=1 Tax=Petrolisthes cinctipes TaxID=88211 RepID=A0AAE1GA17_PETCI|nr:hypothetical protein Pcinc_006668 [Petrolisthes cinctipes]
MVGGEVDVEGVVWKKCVDGRWRGGCGGDGEEEMCGWLVERWMWRGWCGRNVWMVGGGGDVEGVVWKKCVDGRWRGGCGRGGEEEMCGWSVERWMWRGWWGKNVWMVGGEVDVEGMVRKKCVDGWWRGGCGGGGEEKMCGWSVERWMWRGW